MEFSKQGGDPISKLFKNSIKKIKYEVSSHTFDTISAILANYGQILLLFVSIKGMPSLKKKNGGIFQIWGGGGAANFENSQIFFFF